jgi:hypothetical protein
MEIVGTEGDTPVGEIFATSGLVTASEADIAQILNQEINEILLDLLNCSFSIGCHNNKQYTGTIL